MLSFFVVREVALALAQPLVVWGNARDSALAIFSALWCCTAGLDRNFPIWEVCREFEKPLRCGLSSALFIRRRSFFGHCGVRLSEVRRFAENPQRLLGKLGVFLPCAHRLLWFVDKIEKAKARRFGRQAMTIRFVLGLGIACDPASGLDLAAQ